MAFVAGLVFVCLVSAAMAVEVADTKEEDRQIEYALFDYTVLKIKPELEPTRDDCGEDCWFRFTFTPQGAVDPDLTWYSQMRDGEQVFESMDPMTIYDVEVCRVAGSGGTPIITGIRFWTSETTTADAIRYRCEKRVCLATVAPRGSLYWCGYHQWVEQ